MKKHYRHENDCLNCGTELQGKWCHNCGQENLQIKESFGHMIVHAVSDYFHFDHQFFHTLRPMFLKPGKLTNEYMAGRRTQYLHPVKMYIFISLVFFLLFFKQNKDDIIEVKSDNKVSERVADSVANKAAAKLEKNGKLSPAKRALIVRQLRNNVLRYGTGAIPEIKAADNDKKQDTVKQSTAPIAKINADSVAAVTAKALEANTGLTAKQKQDIIEKARQSANAATADEAATTKGKKSITGAALDSVSKNSNGLIVKDESDSSDFVDGVIDGFNQSAKGKGEETFSKYIAKQKLLPKERRDGPFELYIMKMTYKWGRHGDNAKEVFIEAVKHNVPKMMFVLLPIFALILKLVFYKNRKFYVEHLIFSIHLHCFIFLFFTLIIMVKMIIPESWDAVIQWLGFLSTIAVTWYVYRSLRTVYHRSRFRTITKMIGISFTYLMFFSLSMVLLVLITAATAA
jgi:hypothetical protein